MKIKSKNDLFRGEMIDKPRRATVMTGPGDTLSLLCPNCANVADEDECDVLGSEPGCVFCPTCHREMFAG